VGSASSLMVREADVCLMKIWQMPFCNSPISGIWDTTSSVME